MGNAKRAKLPFATDHTKTFEKAWDRYNRAGRHDMNAVREVMWLVACRDPLPAAYSDHALTGDMQGYRELHISGDFLLVYAVDASKKIVIFSNLGTHAELFE
ncbi:type II toxin-antitoxin system YafQ family toxin [Salmonella enterica subsp. enterica serovar Bonariensis]|nr:type II toxin-antitoxin system YafQ family toxin [Salmonella enterica subsp. enterica serovar Bonariensis]EEP1478920.1 type II toxin-antitoxin system YafQ family toxin [Salmonella enterica]EHL9624009.1 type II toxin-antitoxin system YafQ family toxin [Salmonella enterica subsp. enterica serovar Bonariensis]